MIKVGFGAIDITPPLGCALSGYFEPRISEKIHDRLFAHAMVVDDGRERICLISCDLISITKSIVSQSRKLLKEKASIPEDNVIICATHTHTGPYLSPSTLPGKENIVNNEWLTMLPSYISSAAIQAVNTLTPTKVTWAKGCEKNVSFNRRYLLKDGTIKTNPGMAEPDVLPNTDIYKEIIKPVGPIDPEVGVLMFGNEFNDINGLAVNFALHLDTVTGNNISADFPGVLRRVVRQVLGEDTGIVYTSGAMGNINHINFMKKRTEDYKYFEYTERIGTVLGAEVIKSIFKAEKFQQEVKIGAKRIPVKLPLKEYDDESLEKARKYVLQPSGLHNLEYLSGLGMIKAARLGKGEFITEMTALGIGDVAFVSIPGEYFVELGLHIKENSPFPNTYIVELGLESIGYIANKEAYEQEGYEPVSSPLALGAGEKLAEAAITLLKSIR